MEHWQLTEPLDAIIFDCDGTLSQLEGIDELARQNGVEDKVMALTQTAMSKTGMNPELFEERLNLVKPTYHQLKELGALYYQYRVEHVESVIRAFQQLNKAVYIVSAGNNPAVTLFAEQLGIGATNVYAVDLYFTCEGQYQGYDHQSPMTNRSGKRDIVKQLAKQHSRIMHIGDGLNDYAAHDLVTRFVGYGGAFHREKVAECAPFYIRCASLLPLLPLGLTQHEREQLVSNEQAIYQEGVRFIQSHQVIIR